MNQVAKVDEQKSRGLTAVMAERFQMEPAAFTAAIKKTVIKGDCSNEQLAAFLMVAHEYNLNPLTKEVYAFPANGGIQPIVSIDGWMKLINSHPEFDGMDFKDDISSNGDLVSVTCKIYRKDREHPIETTEYMDECKRGTEPWKKWPRRMLRHKAAIQCARYAFSFAGIADPDEYERMVDVTPARSEMSERYSETLDTPADHVSQDLLGNPTEDSQEPLEGDVDTVDPDTGEVVDASPEPLSAEQNGKLLSYAKDIFKTLDSDKPAQAKQEAAAKIKDRWKTEFTDEMQDPAGQIWTSYLAVLTDKQDRGTAEQHWKETLG